MRLIAFIALAILVFSSCEKKEFPVENIEPSVFKVQGTFGGEELSFSPDAEGTFMFTEVEPIGSEAYELITEFRNPDCNDCEQVLRFTTLLGVSADQVESQLQPGDIQFFEGIDSDDISFEVEPIDFEDVDFQEWWVNGEILDTPPDFVGLDDFGSVNIWVEMSDDFGNCDQYMEYTFDVFDSCTPSYCELSFEYEVLEDGLVAFYPSELGADQIYLWTIGFGSPIVMPGNEPFIWEFEDDDPEEVTLTRIGGDFECPFSEFTRTVFPDDDDCPQPSIDLFPSVELEPISIQVEYVSEEGEYYATTFGCDFWMENFDQPESSFFELVSIDDHADNPNGFATRRIGISSSMRLFSPDNPLGEDYIDVEGLSGLIGIALPN